MARPSPRRVLAAAVFLMLGLVPAASARLEVDVLLGVAAVPVLEEPGPEVETAEEPFVLSVPAFGQLTSRYGPRWGRMHHGIDIGILTKLCVLAAAAGKVTHVGYLPEFGGYGKVILINHGDGYETLYSHLARIRVVPGEWVEAGAWIGNAGCTGSCAGTHLHFELRERGTPIDPLPFFERSP